MTISLPSSRWLTATALALAPFAAVALVVTALWLLGRVGTNLVQVMALVESAEAQGFPDPQFASHAVPLP